VREGSVPLWKLRNALVTQQNRPTSLHMPLLLLVFLLLPTTAAAQKSVTVPEVPVRQRDIDRALDLGREWLLEHAAITLRQGERCLMYYAAVQAGLDKQTPVLHEYAEELRQGDFGATYDTACAICFLVALDPVAYMPTIRRATTQLAGFQNANGSWGYPNGEDLSNTQYGALGLWKASTVGVSVDPEVWERLAKRVREYQTKQGGFGYHSSGGNTVNMTTAGVGTLAVCESELLRLAELSKDERKRLSNARQLGLEWLEDRVPAPGSRMNGWPLYGLYGLERMAAWTGLTRLGAHDWYQRGADHLVPKQSLEGNWGASTETAFAVLFLARATSEDRAGIAVTAGSEQDEAGFAVEISSVSPLARLRVEGNGPSFKFGIENWAWPKLRPYEWPGENGRGPRVRAVEHLVNGEVVRVQLVDSTRPMLNQRFRTTVWAKRRGPIQLSMRVHLELPPNRTKDEAGNVLSDVLELGPVELVAIRSLPSHEGSVIPRFEDTRLAFASASAGASSRAPVGASYAKRSHAPVAAIDGDLRTAWLARPNDKRRTWSMRMGRSIATGRLVIHPAVDGGKLGELAQAKLVEVLINGEDRHVLVMPGDGQAGRLNFEPAVEIERLQLRVISLNQAEDGKVSPFGFAEVELQRAGG
jgi:hypothetical protein